MSEGVSIRVQVGHVMIMRLTVIVCWCEGVKDSLTLPSPHILTPVHTPYIRSICEQSTSAHSMW